MASAGEGPLRSLWIEHGIYERDELSGRQILDEQTVQATQDFSRAAARFRQ
jgi:hypothetical protein